jgi:sugar transferase (PEP-CTERM/EpsH1 system associated)
MERRLKILMLTHRLPYPPDKGERIRSYHWLRALACEHQVDLISLNDRPATADEQSALKKIVQNLWVVPLSRWTRPFRLFRALITGRSFTEAYFRSSAMVSLLKKIQAAEQYDLAFAVCSSAGSYFLEAPAPDRLIVDLVDVDSAKWNRYAQQPKKLDRWIYQRESRKIADLERRLSSVAERIITVSPRECHLLSEVAPKANALAIPNGVDTNFFKPADDAAAPNRLVFVGQMDYMPNVDAVLWFADQVWPILQRQHPDLHWTIVGRNPSPAVQELGKLPNITVTGFVPDVRPYLVGAVSIAPIRVSCGVQNKVLEALAAGSPVIASPNVAEGLDIKAQEDFLIAKKPIDWIAAIELLLKDHDLAQRLASQARQTMLQHLTWNHIAEKMLACIAEKSNTREHNLSL